MKTQLYIPKTIKVGYQKREDTYSKKLAYIIYYDDKGKLRKETSWESWRDKEIIAEEYENKPQSGLVLHKDIKRYNWGNFSSKRTMIRVFDPRGIEFEITTENLIGVLMNSDCSKRGLSGKYVYAWSGPELVLLPTSAEEYERASVYTSLQSCKIFAKDLVAGCSYRTKKEGDVIYVGKYNWHSFYGKTWKNEQNIARTCKKYYIFTKDGIKFFTKSGLEFLAEKTTDVVSNFAQIIDNFKNDIHSSAIVSFETVPAEVTFEKVEDPVIKLYPQCYTRDNRPDILKKTQYFRKLGDTIRECSIQTATKCEVVTFKYVHRHIGYHLSESYSFDTKNQKYLQYSQKYDYGREKVYQEKDFQAMGLADVFLILENGNKVKLENLNSLR